MGLPSMGRNTSLTRMSNKDDDLGDSPQEEATNEPIACEHCEMDIDNHGTTQEMGDHRFQCLFCGFATVTVSGFQTLEALNEARERHNDFHELEWLDSGYLHELTLEHYKEIASKHHCLTDLEFQVPYLYHDMVQVDEPCWDE